MTSILFLRFLLSFVFNWEDISNTQNSVWLHFRTAHILSKILRFKLVSTLTLTHFDSSLIKAWLPSAVWPIIILKECNWTFGRIRLRTTLWATLSRDFDGSFAGYLLDITVKDFMAAVFPRLTLALLADYTCLISGFLQDLGTFAIVV